MSEPRSGESNGGSAWESNPARPLSRAATDFEEREGHRAPFTSVLRFYLLEMVKRRAAYVSRVCRYRDDEGEAPGGEPARVNLRRV